MSLLEGWDDGEGDLNTSFGFVSEGGVEGDGDEIGIEEKSEKEIMEEVFEDIFSLDRVDYKPAGLSHLVVSNNRLVMGLKNSHIIRLDLSNPGELEDIEIPSKRSSEKIHKLFLDPTGNHLIISMISEENFYLYSKWNKPRPLSKMKGVIVDAIAWDAGSKDLSPKHTGAILIGTNNGRIFETAIEANEKAFVEKLVGGGKEQMEFKIVYNIGEPQKITGLLLERFITQPNEPPKFFVMATTPTRIYQFIGGPNFEALFANTETKFLELPGELQHSELHVSRKFQGGQPSRFAWLTNPGIYCGELVFASQNAGDSVMSEAELITYPTSDESSSSSFPDPPLSMALTTYHYLLLYPDKVQAICSLNKEVVFEKHLDGHHLIGLSQDTMKGTLWMFADKVVYEIVVKEEDRNMWKLYLQLGQYEEAYVHCKTKAQADKVLTARADYYFHQNNFNLAGKTFAQTQKPFEEIALKFIQINKREALKTYLLEKLRYIRAHKSHEVTQMTLIATWLTEIFMECLNEVSGFDSPPKGSSDNSNPFDVEDPLSEAEQKAAVQSEFQHFLKEYKEYLDHTTTFSLISSHGHLDELLFFAELINDYEKMVDHLMQKRKYHEALEVVKRQPNRELVYHVSPTTMCHLPRETVGTWEKSRLPLDPRRLIPALMRDPHPSKRHAISYLEKIIATGSVDPAVHNFLVSLYATHEESSPPEKMSESRLLRFLRETPRYYDLKYALRLCMQHGHKLACVSIYSAMALYEEATELALKSGYLDEAQHQADLPSEDDSLRKKLWLRIGRHVVDMHNRNNSGDTSAQQQQEVIHKVMDLLSRCDLLKIEDILPFFPDFTRIDAFKDEICSSLQDYNLHIQQLKTEMDEATQSANLIRGDIARIRNRYGVISSHQKCELCGLPALFKVFYYFPCGHLFHSDCQLAEMSKILDRVQQHRVEEILRQIELDEMFPSTPSSPAPSGDQDSINKLNVSKIDELKEELDDYIASECLLCGDLLIQEMSRPFIDPSGEMEMVESWRIHSQLLFDQ